MFSFKTNKQILHNTYLCYPNSATTFLMYNLPINRVLNMENNYNIDPLLNNLCEFKNNLLSKTIPC